MTIIDRRTFIFRGSAALAAVLLAPTGCRRRYAIPFKVDEKATRIVFHPDGFLELHPATHQIVFRGLYGSHEWRHTIPRPVSACCGTDGILWVASEEDQSITALDRDGNVIDAISLRDDNSGIRVMPAAVASEGDRIAWCDRASRKAVVFDRRDRSRIALSVSVPLSAPYEPTDLFFADHVLRVLDAGNRAILEFGGDGRFVHAHPLDWPDDGEPALFVLSDRGNIWLADRMQPRVAQWGAGGLAFHKIDGRVVQLLCSTGGECIAMLSPWLREDPDRVD